MWEPHCSIWSTRGMSTLLIFRMGNDGPVPELRKVYAANSLSPMNSPGAMPPGQANSPPPVWVEN